MDRLRRIGVRHAQFERERGSRRERNGFRLLDGDSRDQAWDSPRFGDLAFRSAKNWPISRQTSVPPDKPCQRLRISRPA